MALGKVAELARSTRLWPMRKFPIESILTDLVIVEMKFPCKASGGQFYKDYAVILKKCALELRVAGLTCLWGAGLGACVALVMERNVAAWRLGLDSNLLAIVYSALITSGMAWWLQGSVMKDKGPVFVSSFNPLGMIIVVIVGLLFLAEDLLLGRLVGALLVILGLYMIVWAKKHGHRVTAYDEGVLPPKQQGEIQLANGGIEV